MKVFEQGNVMTCLLFGEKNLVAVCRIKYFENRLGAKTSLIVHRRDKELPGPRSGVGVGAEGRLRDCRSRTDSSVPGRAAGVGMKEGKRRIERQMLKWDL